MQTRVQNIYSNKNAFSLGCDKEQGAADFSYKPDNKEKVGEDKKTSGKTSGKIMLMIEQDNEITIPELADKIGVTERSIERNIETLKQKGLLKRVGPAKGGHWEVKTVE